ncbi:MAG: CDP-archaeol synthase [Syntrophobacteraceae bacterium]
MMLFLKLLLLLWSINFAPPFVAQVLEGKWKRPLDSGYLLFDGRPLFGSHKTIRGVLAGLTAGVLTASVLDFPLWLGLGAGVLSMSGDLLSSFLKRRLAFAGGDVVPGLDQVPEGLLPFVLLGPYFSLSAGFVLLLGIVFGTGAYYGSIFLNQVLLGRPSESYPRQVRARTRFRELISCKITTGAFQHILNFEDAFYYHFFMKSVFKALGIYKRGLRNALVIEKREVDFRLSGLPSCFDGYKILFLTDLHIDGLDGLTERIVEIVREYRADLCILGGDYRMGTYGSFAAALAQLRLLLPEIHVSDGIYGVLGNHDCLEIVDSLKEEGVTFLINDSREIGRNGESIWIVGVDDYHYYHAANLESAFSEVPPGAFTVFISHSNEVYREASKYRPKLFLCGHTHAGQIQIYPFGPIFTHSSAPRRMCEGTWEYMGMPGYTSAGAGVSGVPVRFNSKGEVTVITLRKASA